MARQQTAARERTEQNKRLAAQVAAQTGKNVTIREAQDMRRKEKAEDTTARYLVVDREVLFPPEDCRRVGQVLAKVLDLKVIRGTYVQLTLQTSVDFMHTLADASALSVGHPLLCTLDELFPSKVSDDDTK